MKMNGNGDIKESGMPERVYRRLRNRLNRLPALFSNLLVGYAEPLNVGNLLTMSWAAQAVYVAAKLGIPDHLRSGPKSVAQLVALSGCVEGRLHQLMRALAGFGVFAADGQGLYRLTPMSQQFADPESDLRLYILLWGEQLWAAAGEMLPMVKSGQVAYELACGKTLYEHYKANPEAGNRFVDFMNSVTEEQKLTLVSAFDFSRFRHVVDIGGGRASLLTSVLQANPGVRGTIFDQPLMADLVSDRIRSSRLEGRCLFAGGNFLESVPSGGDLYLIKHVLHDWDDLHVATILKNISAALPPRGTLIIIEGLMDERNDAGRFLKMRDLEQMVWTGGKVRTRREFGRLLGSAGLNIEETRQTGVRDGTLIITRKT